jgi:hypothetical protein
MNFVADPYPDTAKVFEDMAGQERAHRRRLRETYEQRLSLRRSLGAVVFELWAITCMRARDMDTPFLRAVFQVVLGSVIVPAVGIVTGAS